LNASLRSIETRIGHGQQRADRSFLTLVLEFPVRVYSFFKKAKEGKTCATAIRGEAGSELRSQSFPLYERKATRIRKWRPLCGPRSAARCGAESCFGRTEEKPKREKR